MRVYTIVFTFLILIAGNLGAQTFVSFENEVAYLQSKFTEKVGNKIQIEKDYQSFIFQQSTNGFLNIDNSKKIEKQFFLFIDRNPKKQLIFVLACNNNTIYLIGIDKVSTGNFKRKGHYITPIGIFTNSIDILGYRALGTKNNKGWMGLGIKDARVWDLGWQSIIKNGKQRLIRLQIHATDPVYGEALLGKISSKGCIRISGKLNFFLDYYGIIDKEYEKNSHSKRVSWLMRKNRQAVLYAGKYIIISDSEKLTKHL